MIEDDLILILLEYSDRIIRHKKDNPYWAVNYRRPLKTKKILERLKYNEPNHYPYN